MHLNPHHLISHFLTSSSAGVLFKLFGLHLLKHFLGLLNISQSQIFFTYKKILRCPLRISTMEKLVVWQVGYCLPYLLEY